jgi:hypothetical protein
MNNATFSGASERSIFCGFDSHLGRNNFSARWRKRFLNATASRNDGYLRMTARKRNPLAGLDSFFIFVAA